GWSGKVRSSQSEGEGGGEPGQDRAPDSSGGLSHTQPDPGSPLLGLRRPAGPCEPGQQSGPGSQSPGPQPLLGILMRLWPGAGPTLCSIETPPTVTSHRPQLSLPNPPGTTEGPLTICRPVATPSPFLLIPTLTSPSSRLESQGWERFSDLPGISQALSHQLLLCAEHILLVYHTCFTCIFT
ncbi:hypothetical protein H1C71_040420, partial [Ictidomys tridecemlineatus]